MKKPSKGRQSRRQAEGLTFRRIVYRLTQAEDLLDVVADHVAALEHEALGRGARLTPLETLSTGLARQSRRRAA
jgi:hypothetical protein